MARAAWSKPAGSTRAFAQALGDLVDGEGAVTDQVVAAGRRVTLKAWQMAPVTSSFQMNTKRAVAAGDGDEAELFEQGGDLVVHPLAQDGADAQHGLRQRWVLCAVLREHLP